MCVCGGGDSKSSSSMPNAWKCSEPAVEQAGFTRTFTIESSHRNNSMGYFFLHVIDFKNETKLRLKQMV